MGRTGQFTWVRSQGTQNQPVKLNFKNNWPTSDPYEQSDLPMGHRVRSDWTGGSSLTGWWTALIVSNNVLEYCIIIILHYLGLTFLSFNSMCKHLFIHLFIIYLSIITIGFWKYKLIYFSTQCGGNSEIRFAISIY